MCLQETKIDIWSPSIVKEIGGAALAECVFLPAIGSRDGATIYWNRDLVSIASHAVGKFMITAKVTLLRQSKSFWLTTVYGPADDARKTAFLAELARTARPPSDPWPINGDFNLIYEARDKNNHHLNHRIMGMFRRAIDNAGLKEIKCKNHRFARTRRSSTSTNSSATAAGKTCSPQAC